MERTCRTALRIHGRARLGRAAILLDLATGGHGTSAAAARLGLLATVP